MSGSQEEFCSMELTGVRIEFKEIGHANENYVELAQVKLQMLVFMIAKPDSILTGIFLVSGNIFCLVTPLKYFDGCEISTNLYNMGTFDNCETSLDEIRNSELTGRHICKKLCDIFESFLFSF
jgi:hypothetical protein